MFFVEFLEGYVNNIFLRIVDLEYFFSVEWKYFYGVCVINFYVDLWVFIGFSLKVLILLIIVKVWGFVFDLYFFNFLD